MADQVHMQQQIDGETRDLHCLPAAVKEWEDAGWSRVDAEPTAQPTAVDAGKQTRTKES